MERKNDYAFYTYLYTYKGLRCQNKFFGIVMKKSSVTDRLTFRMTDLVLNLKIEKAVLHWLIIFDFLFLIIWT